LTQLSNFASIGRMTMLELKQAISRLSQKERDELTAHMVSLRQAKALKKTKPPLANVQKKKSCFPLCNGPVGPLLRRKDIVSLNFIDEQDDIERYQRAFPPKSSKKK
jgi:hypothetical protein